jgi:hypothetical protein
MFARPKAQPKEFKPTVDRAAQRKHSASDKSVNHRAFARSLSSRHDRAKLMMSSSLCAKVLRWLRPQFEINVIGL